MEASIRTPRELFEGKEHYEIPPFQRPYVWDEERQWAPLWADISRVAEQHVKLQMTSSSELPPKHFLGATVYESRVESAGDVTRHSVIDGQQRMTTLQVLIDAVHDVVGRLGHDEMAESLAELTINSSARFRGKNERFKLWPSQADRAGFVRAIESDSNDRDDHPLEQAHRFFHTAAERWISGVVEDDELSPPGSEELRIAALGWVLVDGMTLAAIDLSGHDDAQVIFETLNARGTPLLKADLIKNWLFQHGERVGADVDLWATERWAEFDGSWWREEVRQGRLRRSRVDIFLQYWLTMRVSEEIRIDDTFRRFTEFATDRVGDATGADRLIDELRADADVYRTFATLDDNTPAGRFQSRVVEAFDLAAFTPVFLWLLSPNHRVPPTDVQIALEALESWVVRRGLLRMTSRNVNQLVVAVLKLLSQAEYEAPVGPAVKNFLSEQTSDSRVWPSDETVRTVLISQRLYGSVRQWRLQMILGAVENYLRGQSPMYEAQPLPTNLQIEHVLPQGWRTHWNPDPGLDAERAARRDQLVHTLGNLTLVTQTLNISLSNRPWTDREATGLREGGEADRGKRSLIDRYSLLVLNKQILERHEAAWAEQDIVTRSEQLAAVICSIWPGPATDVQEAAQQRALDAKTSPGVLPELAWTEEDVQRLASEVGERTLAVLDTLASDSGRRWQNSDVSAAGVEYAFASLGALTKKVQASFGRSNSPVEYESDGGAWWWSVSPDFAERWNRSRQPNPR